MAEIGQQELKTNYPVVQGLEADEKHDGEENNLIAEDLSVINPKDRVLL